MIYAAAQRFTRVPALGFNIYFYFFVLVHVPSGDVFQRIRLVALCPRALAKHRNNSTIIYPFSTRPRRAFAVLHTRAHTYTHKCCTRWQAHRTPFNVFQRPPNRIVIFFCPRWTLNTSRQPFVGTGQVGRWVGGQVRIRKTKAAENFKMVNNAIQHVCVEYTLQ